MALALIVVLSPLAVIALSGLEWMQRNLSKIEVWYQLDSELQRESRKQVNELRSIENNNKLLAGLTASCPLLLKNPPALASAKAQSQLLKMKQDYSFLQIKSSAFLLGAKGFQAPRFPEMRRLPAKNPCQIAGPMKADLLDSYVFASYESQTEVAGSRILVDYADQYRWQFYSKRRLPR